MVVLAEVGTPSRDAVGLVDGEERDRPALEPGGEARFLNPLRREIEQKTVAGRQLGEDLALFLVALAGMETAGRKAALPEQPDLVLHQGDERRDDDGQPRPGHRRQLITK